jgi:hypothetical protein
MNASSQFDVVIATDIYIPGGPNRSTAEEIRVQHQAGLRTGLCHMHSSTMTREFPVHPALSAALEAGCCTLIDHSVRHSTNLLLFRSPTLIDHLGGPLPDIDARQVALVINHPPVHAAGRIDYILTYVRARLRTTYGRPPKLFPIGPTLRAAIHKYYEGIALLEADDWSNIFDLARFATARTTPRTPIRIGRHTRDVREKWPISVEEIVGAYPERDDVDVRILGGTTKVEELLGRRPRNWTVYEFGSQEPEDFLREIDVFVYFHHPNWIESFGRSIVEAMASGVPPILPSHFRDLCGDAAIYCTPHEVSGWLDMLRDPPEYAERSRRAAAYAGKFGDQLHRDRLSRLGVVKELS